MTKDELCDAVHKEVDRFIAQHVDSRVPDGEMGEQASIKFRFCREAYSTADDDTDGDPLFSLTVETAYERYAG